MVTVMTWKHDWYRALKSLNAIRMALWRGEATFGTLLRKTRLSRPTLASNLKRLQKVGEIESRGDPNDSRVKYYFITEKGRKEIFRQTLGDIIYAIEENIAQMLVATTEVTMFLQFEQRKAAVLPQLDADERYILGSCLSGSIYAITTEGEKVSFFEPLREFLEKVKLVAKNKEFDVESLKSLCAVSFEFKLQRDKLIEIFNELGKVREQAKLKAWKK